MSVKIAYLVTDPNIRLETATGPAAHIKGTLNGLRSHGLDPRPFLLSDYLPSASATASKQGTSTLNHPKNRSKARLFLSDSKRFLGNLILPENITQDIQAFEPDVIYERSWLFSTSGGALAKKLGVAHFIETPACAAEITEKAYGISSVKLANFIETCKFRRAHTVVTESKASLELACKKFRIDPSKAIAKPIGFEDENTHSHNPPTPNAIDFTQRFKFVVGFVGTFGPYQGPDVLMNVIKLTAAASNSVGFLLIGSGGSQTECIHFAEKHELDNVHFTGRVPQQDVSEFLSLCNVGFIPDSDDYICPIKTFNYGVSRLAVIHPDYPAYNGIIESGINGYSFRPRHAEDAAKTILNISKRPEEVRSAGCAFEELVASKFNWHAVTNDIASSLSLCSRPARGSDAR